MIPVFDVFLITGEWYWEVVFESGIGVILILRALSRSDFALALVPSVRAAQRRGQTSVRGGSGGGPRKFWLKPCFPLIFHVFLPNFMFLKMSEKTKIEIFTFGFCIPPPPVAGSHHHGHHYRLCRCPLRLKHFD